jgi:cytochrome d ubiquinol oxidase subunit II
MLVREILLAGVMLGGLILYFVLGGADFGGGVWDLLASGPRRAAQRAFVSHAIGPVWEANHVWLIFVVVLLFTAFPRAFAAIGVALHVPLTLFLVGVVFRGSAFAFQGAMLDLRARARHWGRLFAIASLVAPVLLGMCVGAIASGEIRVEDGRVISGFFAPWLRPFSFAVGLFALAECAFLAAAFLAYEAIGGPLELDFRARALATGAVVSALAALALALSASGATVVFEGLTRGALALTLIAITALAMAGALASLWTRRYALARILAVVQVSLVLVGWAQAQAPWLVVPDLTLSNAAASPATQRAVLWTVVAGLPVLGPSLWLLFRIFKPGWPPRTTGSHARWPLRGSPGASDDGLNTR